MLQNYRGASDPRHVGAEVTRLGDPLRTWKKIRFLATGIAELCFWEASAIADIAPPNTPGGEWLARIIIGFETGTNLFSCPWIAPPFPAPVMRWNPPYNPDEAGAAGWIWETLACNIVVDGGILWAGKRLPENWNDLGVIVSLLMAVFSDIFAICACLGEASDVAQALQILPIAANGLKLGRFTPIVKGTGEVSLLVVAGSDAVFGFIIAVLTVVQGGERDSPDILLASPTGISE
jgi:hypothetical protein